MSSTTAWSRASDSEKCIALRFSCEAICASWSDSSCCNALEFCSTAVAVATDFLADAGATGDRSVFGDVRRFELKGGNNVDWSEGKRSRSPVGSGGSAIFNEGGVVASDSRGAVPFTVVGTEICGRKGSGRAALGAIF